MLLLEQDITRKKQINKNNIAELDIGDNKSKENKVKAIWDSAVYAKKVKINSSARALLSSFLKKLSKRKKYLKAYISHSAP